MKTNTDSAQLCINELEKQCPTLVRRGIFIEESIPEGALLFIGINPSFKDGDPVPGMEGYIPTYPLDNLKHPYFKKAEEIAHEMGLPFGHHDLFPFRESNQKVIEQMFDGAKDGLLVPKKEFHPFVENSLLWSEATIIKAKPKMIVVINAFASRLFFDTRVQGKTLLGFKPANDELWSKELGADYIRMNNQVVPILFSGMLSGQRALDRYSEFRLCWHINHVLSHLDCWPKA